MTCGHGNDGMHWSTYAKDGDMSSSHGLTISTYNLTADPEQRWRRALDIWPANLLINIRSDLDPENWDDIVAALGHRDRIAGIEMTCRTMLQLERCTAVMQEPFPVLRALSFRYVENDRDAPPVVLGALLGGSAPRLQAITLWRVPFPTLPELLLSTKDLVKLNLDKITSAGYISLEALATCLSMLKGLEHIGVGFQSVNSFPSLTNRSPPPLTRAVLPALKTFVFEGVSEYSEDLIARIDALCLVPSPSSSSISLSLTSRKYPTGSSYVASKFSSHPLRRR